MRKIVINENSQLTYIPDELIKDGYKGEVDVLAHFCAVALLRPGSTIDDQISSLETIIKDLKLRKKVEVKEA